MRPTPVVQHAAALYQTTTGPHAHVRHKFAQRGIQTPSGKAAVNLQGGGRGRRFRHEQPTPDGLHPAGAGAAH